MLPHGRSLYRLTALLLTAGASVGNARPASARSELVPDNHAKVLPCRL